MAMPTTPESVVQIRLAVISRRKAISLAITAFCTEMSAPGSRISANTRSTGASASMAKKAPMAGASKNSSPYSTTAMPRLT